MNQNTVNTLENLLRHAVEDFRISNPHIKKVASALGGIDSFVTAYLLKDLYEVELFTVGFPDSEDYQLADFAANKLGLKLNKISLDKCDIKNELVGMTEVLNDNDVLVSSYSLPFFIVSEIAKSSGFGSVACGQGSDEMMLSYSEYKKMDDSALFTYARTRYDNLMKLAEKREKEICRTLDLKFFSPFMNKDLSEFVLNLPVNERYDGNMDKIPLRMLVKKWGFPEEIYNRKKKAVQYGSGLMKYMKKHKEDLTFLNWVK